MKENILLERLAAQEHDQWCQWAQAMLLTEDISKERRERWEKLLCTYEDLPEEYKEKDRLYAKDVLEIVRQYLYDCENN